MKNVSWEISSFQVQPVRFQSHRQRETTRNLRNMAVASVCALSSFATLAACPPNLSAEEAMYCVTVEGAGNNYQTYMKDRAEAQKQAAEVKPTETGTRDAAESGRTDSPSLTKR